jgi:hypothetical protein
MQNSNLQSTLQTRHVSVLNFQDLSDKRNLNLNVYFSDNCLSYAQEWANYSFLQNHNGFQHQTQFNLPNKSLSLFHNEKEYGSGI